jgi:hypothetical protein
VFLLLLLLLQVRDREEAARISNAYAPEHLIVNVQDAESWLPLLDNAGSIFMGRWEDINWMREIGLGLLPCISLLLVLLPLPDWNQDHRLPDYPFWGQARLIENSMLWCLLRHAIVSMRWDSRPCARLACRNPLG